MEEFLIGGHVSASGGVLRAFENAEEIGANVVQIFTQSPRMWKAKQIDEAEATQFRENLSNSRFKLAEVVTHASYLINLASNDSVIIDKSREALRANIESAAMLGASGVVLHVGSHKGLGLSTVLGQIAQAIGEVLDHLGSSCKLLLENTAGQGGTVGVGFDELKRIIDALGGDDRVGLCLDTQHLFASGVSFSTIEESDGVVQQIDEIVGIERLGCIHLNDSKVAFGSMRDRHENLGRGSIGGEALAGLISHPKLRIKPMILEVPGDGKGPRAADVKMACKLLSDGIKVRDS